VNEPFSEMPFSVTQNNINNSDNSSAQGPVEKFTLNPNEDFATYRDGQRLSRKAKRTSIKIVKSPLRWPLLFLFVNCVVLISSMALCFSPASFFISGGYGISVFQVSLCGTSFTATYIPATLTSVYLY
jgi:hypothetical protein